MKKILVVAPHLDDDILGCGGTMYKKLQSGSEVYVAIMTNGNVGDPNLFPVEGTERGRLETHQAHEILGVTETFYFDFPAPRLETFPGYKISIELEKLIRKLEVDTLFLPHRGDIHKDHRAIFEAALVAARPINGIPVKRIFTYETLSESEWAPPYSDEIFYPTFFVTLTREEMEKKIKAFSCYTNPRLKDAPHPRSIEGITNLARLRGSTIEKGYAEAFMHIRTVE